MITYTWDDRTGRYRDARGLFVSDSTVRKVIDDIADEASSRMAQAAEALLDGRMSLGAFQAEIARDIKLAHTAAAVIANGGEDAMTFSRWGSVGQIVRQEYAYLKSFADDIASGRQPLNRTIVARAEMYGQAPRAHFERVRRASMQQRGYQAERNLLHAAESCGSCRGQSALGWVPIGTLIPVGSRTCLSRCRCTLSYREDTVESEAAA